METPNFLIILLLPIIVSSATCQNPKVSCIKLCCGFTQIYEPDTNYCKDLSKREIDRLQTLMRTDKSMEYIEYGECEKSMKSGAIFSSTIPICDSVSYDESGSYYIYDQHLMVPCERKNFPSTKALDTFKFNAFECLTTMLLLILLIYSFTRKGKRDNISFKLVTWYMTSIVATAVTAMVKLILNSPYLMILHDFFSISTCLWLSSIGFEIYKGFKTSNNVIDSEQIRKRFRWYSLYVWASSIVIILFVLVAFGEFGKRWYLLILSRLVYVIALYNFAIFLELSWKICNIRSKVASMTTEDDFVCNILRILLRLSIMMGIPRMLCIILEPLLFFGFRLVPIVFFLEPYLVFLTFVAEGENLTSLYSKCCCCFKRTDMVQENGNTNETMLQQSIPV